MQKSKILPNKRWRAVEQTEDVPNARDEIPMDRAIPKGTIVQDQPAHLQLLQKHTFIYMIFNFFYYES